jgi:hypothetical protein
MTIHNHSSLDEILILVAIGLQLPKSKRELATQKYHSVGEYLEKEGSPFYGANLDIYPQGSMAIGTTVKPRKNEEYDIDLVLQMDHTPHHDNPVHLLDTLESYLRANGNYADIVERRNRCVCLNYAGDFHLDIIPATPDLAKFTCDSCVVVPDRELKEWSPSNPLGFARWFNLQAFEEHHGLMFAECRVHPVPGEEPGTQKPPLKRVVQLLKRHRDVFFNGGKKTPSIILTTLAGNASHELGSGQYSVADLFYKVLVYIQKRIEAAHPRQIKVLNPTNPEEVFSEKWEKHPERYRKFADWVEEAIADVQALAHAKSKEDVAAILGKMFGDTRVSEAIKAQASALAKARGEGGLGVAAGTGIISSVPSETSRPVRQHTFYGDMRIPGFDE